MKKRSIWKVIGLAGLAGVAATGVAVARSERQRRSYTPEDVRARLRDRLQSMEGPPEVAMEPDHRQQEQRRSGSAEGWSARRRSSKAEPQSHRV